MVQRKEKRMKARREKRRKGRGAGAGKAEPEEKERRGGGEGAESLLRPAEGRAEGGGCVRGSHGRGCPPRQPPSLPRCAGCRKPPRRRFCCQGPREERRPPVATVSPCTRSPAAGPGRSARPAHEGDPRPPLPPARGGAALRQRQRCPLCGKKRPRSIPEGTMEVNAGKSQTAAGRGRRRGRSELAGELRGTGGWGCP